MLDQNKSQQFPNLGIDFFSGSESVANGSFDIMNDQNNSAVSNKFVIKSSFLGSMKEFEFIDEEANEPEQDEALASGNSQIMLSNSDDEIFPIQMKRLRGFKSTINAVKDIQN